MSTEVSTAFDHPEVRAAATAGRDPLDRISLRDHVVEVEIGAFQSERGKTQRVNFNIVVEVRPTAAPVDDDVDRILSYDTITQAIRHELAAERLNLLETLAERIAQSILAEPQAERVFVRIEKLDRGPGALGVEIVRTKGQVPASVDHHHDDAPHPVVVFLSNSAIQSSNLSGWLDQLQAAGAPVILCVGPADTPAPHSAAPAAQRRIDLLAIEQNAWVLAGRDRRCVVMGSRTELDWAARNAQMSVWAPSKMVLDAVDGPSAQPHDAAALIGWFADVVHAERLICVGTGKPKTSGLAVLSVPVEAAAIF
ncbi:MAG: dihydroneopterin aldolase [Paracoccaceae bacterium]